MAGDVLVKLDLAFEDGTRVLVRPLARHPSESSRHFALRVAALLFAWTPQLEIREGVCRGQEPALFDPGPPRTWFDIGKADAARRRRALSRADRHVLVIAAASGRRPASTAKLAARIAERCEEWDLRTDELERLFDDSRRLRGRVTRSVDGSAPDRLEIELDVRDASGARRIAVERTRHPSIER